MNPRIASSRSSSGTRKIADGCSVAMILPATSDRSTSPRCCVNRNVGPSNVWAAVAPSATINDGFTTASSASQPRTARAYLVHFGGRVNAASPALHELEMFDRIGNVDCIGIDARSGHAFMQHASRRTHEWMPLQILAIAGLLPDENQLCTHGTFAEDRLRSVYVEIAALTTSRCVAQSLHREPLGNERVGRSLWAFHAAAAGNWGTRHSL
jgi:hypothetical protein